MQPTLMLMAAMRLWLLAVLLPGVAEAGSVGVHSASDACPSSERVIAHVRTTLPQTQFVEAGGDTQVELQNEGLDYTVRIGDTTKQFSDRTLDCEERARKAAVLVVLALAPPSVVNPARPPRAPMPTDDVRFPSVNLEIGGTFVSAPSAMGSTPLSGGARLRLYVGTRFVGGVVGVSGLAPTTLELAGTSARLIRVPFDLAVRGRLILRRFVLTLDLGVVLGLQQTEGLNVQPAAQESRLEVGLLCAARLEIWPVRRIAPFLSFETEYIPTAYNLTLPSTGTVGTTPTVWLGVVLGVAVRIR